MENGLAKFDQMKADITLFVEPCLSIEVKDQEGGVAALEAGKQVKAFMKKVEERRDELVRPLNEEVKRINAYAKQIKEPLEAAETHIKKQLKALEDKLRAEREKEMKRIEAERIEAEKQAAAKAAAEKEEAATLAMFMDKTEVKKAEIVADIQAERAVIDIQDAHKKQVQAVAAQKVSGSRLVWKFEVTDETKIPRQFLVLDEKLVNQAIRSGLREVEGLRIYQDSQIAL